MDKESTAQLEQSTAAQWKYASLNILKGALIGVGAILPGISGGVLCVVFGIYKPMMAFLTHPFKALKAYYKLLIPALVGWAAGFLGLARLVQLLFSMSYAPAVWLFIGLIAGTLPSLYRTAGEQGRPRGAYVACGISFAVFLSWMLFLNMSAAVNITPNAFWWAVSGALWGIGLIVPGLSASSFLIFLGLYTPLTEGIASLSFPVLIPYAAGIALIVLLFARAVNMLIYKAHSMVFHVLLGIVAASAIAIIPIKDVSYSFLNCLLYAACFALGVVIAISMDKLSLKIARSKSD